MSEHSTEELRRQLDMAVSKLNAAQLAKIYAERRLHERLCRDSGLMGKVARYGEVAILVHDVGFFGHKPSTVRGFRFKKDGTLGERESTFYNLASVKFEPHPDTLTDEAKLRRSQALDELGALDGDLL
jgi:hypothetical protein